MDELTERLIGGEHPVRIGGPRPSVPDLRQRVTETGFVNVAFVGTRGGTELGLRLDPAATDAGSVDFEAGLGKLHLEGTLILNGDPVRCVADIDLATLDGTGRLVPVDASEVAAG